MANGLSHRAGRGRWWRAGPVFEDFWQSKAALAARMEHSPGFPPQRAAAEVLAVCWPSLSLPDQEPAAAERLTLPLRRQLPHRQQPFRHCQPRPRLPRLRPLFR